MKFPLQNITVDMVLPTNEAVKKLSELHWNWAAQDSIICFNCSGIDIKKEKFYRIINGTFFDVKNDGLVTRRIKWLDLVPIRYIDNRDGTHEFDINLKPFSEILYKLDCKNGYPLPSNFKYQQLQRVNRFVEFIGNSSHSEAEITEFLSQQNYNFILKMAFFGKDIYHQKSCVWQAGNQKKSLMPDFFIVKPNGYADIVEFKLPRINRGSVVGSSNREAFSAEINSCIAQTRMYEEYFDESANRRWVEEQYGFKVLKPKRYLVIGRRWNFSSKEWRNIQSDYRNIEIMTYDDLIDGVVSQFYISKSE